jgi:hypothetical protein
MQSASTKSIAGLVLAAIWSFGSVALAETAPPANARYHFEVTAVTAKPAVKPDVAKMAISKVQAEVKKVFAEHPQLVAKLDGAPDPRSNAEAYRNYLTRNRIAGAYRVTIVIKEASETLTPAAQPGDQRLAVRLVLHMVGEKVPDGTIGFNGHGNTTVKQDIGPTVRDSDREGTWKDVTEVVVSDAVKTALEELSAPPKDKPKHSAHK